MNQNQLIEIIRKAKQERATKLNLNNNGLTSLPPEIGQLTQLKKLILSFNQLTTLPSEFGKLTQLQELSLHDNQLMALPLEFGKLTQLTALWLQRNWLTALPPEIGKLTQLKGLDLSHNKLILLPPEIGQLTQLKELSLSYNWLMSLTPEIGKLKQLKILWLYNNQLTSFPPEFGQLTQLKELWLQNNQLTSLPSEIRQLTQLEQLYLQDNPGLNIPPEILGPTREDVRYRNIKPSAPQTILDYYFRTRLAGKGGRRPLNEVKVILVGQGSVGKTSLVKRIVFDTFNKREKKTPGIYINKDWSVPGKGGKEKVQVNFWDFGGQEIMHATHQFFLTQRTVYVLVLDARKGENESNIHYWLKIIRSYGGDSPILVVTNKCEEHHLEINRTRLKKDYPNIRGFLKTSCDTGEGIKALRQAIAKQVHGMKHVFDPLPMEYFRIKDELEKLAGKKNFIQMSEYYTLCVKNNVTDQKEQDHLLRFLHDLGSVLSFNDPDSPFQLREMSVLNPLWVTKGVYKVLNYTAVAKRGGVLLESDLAGILPARSHPKACYGFIIEMMKKFELCFAIDEGKKWLVAELLPVNEPDVNWNFGGALNFQYHYDVLPGGIICRFIVRRYVNLTDKPTYWRSGVVLKLEGCKALVRSDTDKGRMFISVRGPENCRRSALAVIRDEFQRIHSTVPKLEPKEMVPLPEKLEVTVSYKHLLRLEESRQTSFLPEGADRNYTVMELLDGIEDMLIRGWNRFGYRMLQPPFFVVEPETKFSDAWEVFCCDVLNRHHKTTEIYQRKPPEGGVDLYWPARKTAYQCKSVEEETGRFSLTKAMESINSALETRKHLSWEKYVLCSNVVLTGDQERKLREKLPEIELLTPSFWQPRCLEQREHLRDRFRILAHTGEDGRIRPEG